MLRLTQSRIFPRQSVSLVTARFYTSSTPQGNIQPPPNPRIHRNAIPRQDDYTRYMWRDLSSLRSWKQVWEHLNPRYLYEANYWRYTWTRRPIITILIYGVIIPIFAASSAAVLYDQLRPDNLPDFPRPVRRELRKAIYWAKYKRDDARAMKHFARAYEAMIRLRMDQFGDGVLGVNLFMIKYMGVMGNMASSKQIFEGRVAAIKEWLGNFEDLVDRGIIDRWGAVVGVDKGVTGEELAEKVRVMVPAGTGENEENLWGRRTRLLKWLIVMHAEMGSQCHGETSTEDMHKEGRGYIEWALNETLKENKRRFEKGVMAEESDWLSEDQIANLYQVLGNAYHHVGEDRYSIPLYFKSLQLCKDHCSQAVIMTALATSFYNWDPKIPIPPQIHTTLSPSAPIRAPPNPLGSRRRRPKLGANRPKHITLLGSTNLPDTCKEAFFQAKMLQGELLWNQKKYGGARRCWTAAREMAVWGDFVDGLRSADEALARKEADGAK